MADPTFAELVAPSTAEAIRARLYALLAASPAGFPVTSWREGDVARTLVEIDAAVLAEETTLRTAIAKGGLLEEATGAWLTLLASQVYGIAKNEAVATVGTVRLTAVASAGPYTISPGELWVSTASGIRYSSTNAVPITIAQGGTLDVEVRAELPGAASAVGNGAITVMVTPLAGVTVANPDPGTGSWMTTPGADAELDDSLKARCRSRWAELGTGSPGAAYDLWARTASAAVTRTKVAASGTVAGGVDVYLAGASGAVGSGVVDAVAAYVAARAPLSSVPNVASATNAAQNLTAILYGKAQYETAALAAAEAAFRALIAATAIGGSLFAAAKIEALMSPSGVENATISVGGSDVALTSAQVATAGTIALTWSNT